MCKNSLTFHVACFRHRLLAWIMLTVLCFFFMPSVSLAQQPTATIRTLSGEVLVSGQAVAIGMVLQAGDTVQTQAETTAVLELSDGSQIHLDEKTEVRPILH